MRLVGRRTYVAEWEYCSGVIDSERKVLAAPPEAPARFYTATLV